MMGGRVVVGTGTAYKGWRCVGTERYSYHSDSKGNRLAVVLNGSSDDWKGQRPTRCED